jgi:2-polyprenyl-3-methyl-5-hydroxy-6-metoxy-1,4-benzoquinol methylase
LPEDLRLCPLCGSDRSLLFDRGEHLGRLVRNRMCAACGLVYQSPRMTADEARDQYAAEYRRTVQGGEGPTAKDLEVQTRRADLLVHFLKRRVRRLASHLDIGCSAGLLLARTRAAYRLRAVGVEPGDAYREHARAQGLTVHRSLDEALAAGERFDLVSLVHVLEHLPDPAGTLNSLRADVLSPDGWLLVEVPNLYLHTPFEYEHLFSFSRRTLAGMLRKAGFRVVAVRVHGRPLSQILPFYVTVLARPAKAARRPARIRPERGVAFKHTLGWVFKRIVTGWLPRRWWSLAPLESYAHQDRSPGMNGDERR